MGCGSSKPSTPRREPPGQHKSHPKTERNVHNPTPLNSAIPLPPPEQYQNSASLARPSASGQHKYHQSQSQYQRVQQPQESFQQTPLSTNVAHQQRKRQYQPAASSASSLVPSTAPSPAPQVPSSTTQPGSYTVAQPQPKYQHAHPQNFTQPAELNSIVQPQPKYQLQVSRDHYGSHALHEPHIRQSSPYSQQRRQTPPSAYHTPEEKYPPRGVRSRIPSGVIPDSITTYTTASFTDSGEQDPRAGWDGVRKRSTREQERDRVAGWVSDSNLNRGDANHHEGSEEQTGAGVQGYWNGENSDAFGPKDGQTYGHNSNARGDGSRRSSEHWGDNRPVELQPVGWEYPGGGGTGPRARTRPGNKAGV